MMVKSSSTYLPPNCAHRLWASATRELKSLVPGADGLALTASYNAAKIELLLKTLVAVEHSSPPKTNDSFSCSSEAF